MFKKKKKEAEAGEEFSDEEMDQIMDEVETGGPGEAGNKTRSKNTKIALISIIGLVLIAGIYFGSKYYGVLLVQKDKLMVMAGLKKEESRISEAEKKAVEEERARFEEIESRKKEERMAIRKKEREEGKTQEENVAKEVPSEASEPTKQTPIPPSVEKPKEDIGQKDNKRGEESRDREKTPISGTGKELENSAKAEKPAAPSRSTSATTSPSGEYAIQAGSFAVKENAVSLIKNLTERGFEAFGVPFSDSARSNIVYAGPFYSRVEAEEAAKEMQREGIRNARVTYDREEAIYKVDAGSYSSMDKAKSLEEEISRVGFESGRETQKASGSMTAVFIGNFADGTKAEEVRKSLPKEIVPSSFVVKSPKR